MQEKKSTPFNINANIIVLISYLGGLILMWIPTICYIAWILPFLIYITETKNKYIKDQSSQALFIYLLTALLSLIVYIFLVLLSTSINFDHIYNILASGSLIIILLISLFVSLVKIVTSFFICIASIKSWNYENYEIPYLKPYLKIFRKLLTKLENRSYTEEKKSTSNYSNNKEKEQPHKKYSKRKIHTNKKEQSKIKSRKLKH